MRVFVNPRLYQPDDDPPFIGYSKIHRATSNDTALCGTRPLPVFGAYFTLHEMPTDKNAVLDLSAPVRFNGADLCARCFPNLGKR